MTGYANMSAYRRTQVEQGRPEEILLRFFEEGVRRARQVHTSAAQGELIPARENALRTLKIVTELDGSLDRENGGAIVEELEALYSFLLREISYANRKQEFDRFQQVEDILRTLYEGWKDAVAEYQAANGEAGDAGVAVGARV